MDRSSDRTVPYSQASGGEHGAGEFRPHSISGGPESYPPIDLAVAAYPLGYAGRCTAGLGLCHTQSGCGGRRAAGAGRPDCSGWPCPSSDRALAVVVAKALRPGTTESRAPASIGGRRRRCPGNARESIFETCWTAKRTSTSRTSYIRRGDSGEYRQFLRTF